MKRFLPQFVFAMLMAWMIFYTNPVFADSPPPPPGPQNIGNHTPPGGGASIEGGLIILAALGLAYGAQKIYGCRIKTSTQV